MADESTYLIRLVAWLGRAVGDSEQLFADFETDDLGAALPAAVVQAPAVVTALDNAAASAARLRDAAGELETVAATGDELELLAGMLLVGTLLGEFYARLDALVTAVRNATTTATVPDAGERAAATAFADELAKRVSDYALASAITERIPLFAVLLRLAGLLDWRFVEPPATDPLATPHVRKALALDRAKDLVADPPQHFRDTLGWGAPTFDPLDVFRLLTDFFDEEVEVEAGVDGGDPFLRFGGFLLRRDSTVSPPGLRASFTASFDADHQARTELTEEWGAAIESALRLTGTVAARVTPPLELSLQPAAAQVTGEVRAWFDRNPDARPFDIVAGTGLLTVSATNATAGLGLAAEWSSSDGRATIDPLLFAAIDGLKLTIGTADADSFIGSLLAAAEISGEFDLGFEWQASSGLRVVASGGVEIALPIHRAIGPIELQTLYLSLRIRDTGALAFEVSAALSGILGPLSASVDRIGALLDLRFADDTAGALGPFDLSLGFKPPNGIGLAIDAGVVKGGGYVFIDAERGEYAGALELVVANWLALKAIGLISTRMPDGSEGFSLLVIITAEFGTGLQLGYGFTLIGVGGLVGLNRSMRIQPIMEGVRTGAIEGVMFPQDLIANAPRIISDLKAFFPPQQDRFLIGPLAKLGWGTPTLVSLTLGVIIEIPGNIVILGVLKVALPTEKAAVVSLQVNFAGAIEFDRKRVYFFASLFDSRILFLTIEGEMAVLAAFGEDADFVLSVGGFHPRFDPPPLPVPTPKRLAINILDTDSARLRVEGYFAVTTNTAQFGARAEAYFGFSAFKLEGSLAFDALLQFSPLYFIVELSCSFSLKVFGIGVFSLRARIALEGPTPWRARGTGSISLLFFEISADFDITWGEDQRTELPPIDVMPLLHAELDKQEAWTAQLPAGANLLVTLRTLTPAADGLVLHPVGTLRLSQRAVPLDQGIDKVGNQRVNDARRFTLAVAGGGLARRGDTTEQFAPAQFRDFDDAGKLSAPAFEPGHGGMELSVDGAQLRTGTTIKRVNRYELITVDTAGRRSVRRFHAIAGGLFAHFVKGAAVTRIELAGARAAKLDPFGDRVAVGSDPYVVARTADNAAHTQVFASRALALDALERELAGDPRLAADLHVIPAFEAAA